MVASTEDKNGASSVQQEGLMQFGNSLYCPSLIWHLPRNSSVSKFIFAARKAAREGEPA